MWAANPDDLDLSLRLTRDPPVFHAGESLEFEISYSTRTEGKYRGTWTNPSADLEFVGLHLSPTSGLVDLRSLHEGAYGGSFLSSFGNLDPKDPMTQKADLTDWYRFEKGGHYEFRVSSPQVISRIKTAEEGGGLEPIALESNTIEFDVLPRDAAWETQELTAATQDLGGDAAVHAQAIRRLVLLDTPASIAKLVSLFLAEAAPVGDATPTSSPDNYLIYRGLEESGRPASIVPLLEAALEDPQRRPASNLLVNLLAGLQVRQELGPPEEKEPDWAKRDQRRQDYLKQDTAKLLASIRQRSGPQRSAALFQAWQLTERSNSRPEEASAALVQLRQEVLASAKELPLDDLISFVTQVWNQKSMPREQVLPLVRYLALAAGRPKEENYRLQFEAYPLWCEESPRECSEAILADAANPDSPLLSNTILLVTEAEHPELDASLKERLAEPGMLTDYMKAQKTGALVMRAGSRNLQPAVKEALAQLAGHASNCDLQAYLLGYQLRFAPKDATQYLRAAFQDKERSCGWLRFLGQQRYSDDLIPIALEALDSPNPSTAASGALFLGAHGSADVEDVLWGHLDAFWEQWRNRAAELRSAMPGLSGAAAAAQLEQSLVNALVHSANWKLTLAEQDRLRSGCLTDNCQKVAAGEISLGG